MATSDGRRRYGKARMLGDRTIVLTYWLSAGGGKEAFIYRRHHPEYLEVTELLPTLAPGLEVQIWAAHPSTDPPASYRTGLEKGWAALVEERR
ncbi:MAG: hypothetical protein AAGF12_25635 [Myxococcota bacterium]